MSKFVLHGKDARDAILKGVDFLADVVKVTEGPRGRNIVLGQRMLGQSPKITRDGVTVSNYVDPADPSWQLGADLIREAAQKTDNSVGDGTTAAITLSQAMIHKGFDLIDAGANPMALERGIHKATDAVIEHLRQTAQAADDTRIFQVATVSAHGDTYIGHLVAEAIEHAGKDGVITAEPSSTAETSVETVVGMELPKSGLLHQVFITHPEEMKSELHDCRVLLWEGVIATAKSLVPLLTQLNQANPQFPLLIVAGGYEPEVLAVLIKNKAKLALPLNVVRMDAYGDRRKEIMRDIAALTGGKAYTDDMGLKIDNVMLKDLGVARRVITTMSKTQIIEGHGNQGELAGRVALIRQMMESAAPIERPPLKARLAALLGGITVIKVGGVTVTEMEEKRDRVVDAMSAARAAAESGIVEGGGMALMRASSVLASFFSSKYAGEKDELPGVEVVQKACHAIARQIAENAGLDGDLTLNQLDATSYLGYNAHTNRFERLLDAGIVDPMKVVCESLQNASAVACSILTMGATVAEVQEKAQ